MPKRFPFWLGACTVAIVMVWGGGMAAADVKDRRELVLSPGEQRSLSGEGVDAISTGAPGIVEVRITDDQKQVLIVGMAPGNTTLLMLMKDGRKVEYQVTVSRIRPRRNVRLDFYFVQMSRSYGTQLGILWPGGIGGTISGQASIDQSGVLSASASVVSQVIPRIDFASNRGYAKVIQQARVVMANGEEGSYSSGGEVNVRLATGFATNLQKIPYGTDISSRASYDDITGRIELRVNAEVSALTRNNPTDNLPGRSVLHVNTTVNLELGQSVALAGLFSDDHLREVQGLPLLSEIPVFGLFFGSRLNRKEQTENVVFIVPTLVTAVALEERDRVAEAFALWEQAWASPPRPVLIHTVGEDRLDRPPAPSDGSVVRPASRGGAAPAAQPERP